MQRNKILLLITYLFLTLACTTIGFPEVEPTFVPLPTSTQIAPTLPATPTIFYTPVTIYPEATLLPEWVTEFADPILFAIKNERPVFQDDFSTYRGWINRNSGIKGYAYAERYEEKLLLTMAEDVKESVFYNPRLNYKNFVLTLDLRFHHNQPEDTLRFQFDGFENEHVAFDLSNNREWTFHWKSSENKLESISGVYPHFPPDYVPVTIIMLDTECAVYINNDPLVYVDDCRILPTNEKESDWLTSFHLLREHQHAVLINIDNLKLWDLDRIK